MTRPVVLVVDDERDFLESVGEILREAGFETDLAGSAPQALEFASRRRPAAVVLDIAMPGVDGIQLLRYFRSRHLFRLLPVILLTAGVRKDALEDALEMGVKDVLLKTKFSPDELVRRIRQKLTSIHAEVRRVVDVPTGRPAATPSTPGSAGDDSSQLQRPSPPTPQMIEAIAGLRALPKVVSDLLRLAARPEASLLDMEAVLRGDPVLAARVLRAANSAAYSRGIAGDALEEAVRTLGFANIAKIAGTAALLTADDLDGPVGHDLRILWRHSLAAATYAERMATGSDRAEAYLGGLLHDLPSLFALQYLGSDWIPWREQARMKGIPFHEALSLALGCPLESLCQKVLEAYRLPSEVAGPVLEYHEYFLADRPRQPGLSARRLDHAHQFAAAAGRPGTEFSAVRSLLVDELRPFRAEEVLRYSDDRGLSHHEQESGIGEPQEESFPDLDGAVALWRDPRWCVPDPIETIVSGMCDCLTVERFDDLVQPGRRRLAIVEPGTPEWTRLGQVAPLVVLHRGALPDAPLEPGVDAIPMPVSVLRLAHALGRLPRRN
jgi:CheY-like chemotaxis protein/HD-like signal output (HDOD) protein